MGPSCRATGPSAWMSVRAAFPAGGQGAVTSAVRCRLRQAVPAEALVGIGAVHDGHAVPATSPRGTPGEGVVGDHERA